MPRAAREQRALRRDLLRARAAAERLALAGDLQSLHALARRGLPGVLLGAARTDETARLPGLIAGVWHFLRRRPWLVSSLAGAGVRLLRARPARRALLAGLALGGIAWWWHRRREPAPPISPPPSD